LRVITNALDGRRLRIEGRSVVGGDGANFPEGSKHSIGVGITEAKKIKITRRDDGDRLTTPSSAWRL
jgi:hypothetical protein